MSRIPKTALFVVVVLAAVLSACERGVAGPSVDVPGDVADAAKERLSVETGIPAEEMEIVEGERRDWPDSCLGLGGPDEACLTVITPGWRITIRAEGEEHVLRTDEDGAAVRLE